MRFPQFRQFVVAIVLHALCIVQVHAELNVPVSSIDLGVIRSGQKLTQTFDLVNAGNVPIEILAVDRACGCLAPRLEQRMLSAGAKTTLTIELRTLGQAAGPHTWNVDIKYRAGQETKSLALTLRGTIKSDITVQPAILGIYVAKTLEQVVLVSDARPTPLRIVHAEARAPGVQVATIERLGNSTRILLTADATRLDPGRHEGVLSITTDDADYEQLHVPIVVTKVAAAAVICVPEEVSLRLAPGAKSASALVRLRSRNDQAVRIAKIEPSDPALKCTWVPGPGNDATVKILIPSSHATKMAPGQIIVHLEGAPGVPITIPVRTIQEAGLPSP